MGTYTPDPAFASVYLSVTRYGDRSKREWGYRQKLARLEIFKVEKTDVGGVADAFPFNLRRGRVGRINNCFFGLKVELDHQI